MPRCFIAIPFPETVTRQLASYESELQTVLPRLRWTPPRNLHLTLRFLAEQPEDSLEKLGEIVLSVGRSSPPLKLTLAGLGAFPSWTRANVVWLGVTATPALGQLHRELTVALERMGMPPEERPFHPHVTLGRTRQRNLRLPDPSEGLRSRIVADFTAGRLTLFRSQLMPSGAEHTPLVSATLDHRDIICH